MTGIFSHEQPRTGPRSWSRGKETCNADYMASLAIIRALYRHLPSGYIGNGNVVYTSIFTSNKLDSSTRVHM